MHSSLSLPSIISAKELTNEAALRGVIVAPGEIFSIDGKLDDGIRITFSDNDPDAIQRGISRLSDAVSAVLGRGAVTEPNPVFEIV